MDDTKTRLTVIPDEPVSPQRIGDYLESEGEPTSPTLHKGHLQDGAPVRCEFQEMSIHFSQTVLS